VVTAGCTHDHIYIWFNKLGNQLYIPGNAASCSLRQLDAKITSFVI